MLHRMKIGTRLFSIMGLLLLLFAISVTLAVSSMDKLSSVTNNLFQHPFLVATTTVEVIDNIQDLHLLAHEALLSVDKREIVEADLVKSHELQHHIQQDLNLIFERYLGAKAEIELANRLFLEYQTQIDDVFTKLKAGQQAAAQTILADQVGPKRDQIEKALQKIGGFARERAIRFSNEAQGIAHEGAQGLLAVSGALLLLGLLFFYRIARSIIQPIRALREAVYQMTQGNYTAQLPPMGNDEIGELAKATAFFSRELMRAQNERERADWIKAGRLSVDEKLRGNPDRGALCRAVLGEICRHVDAAVGAIYSMDREDTLLFEAGFAYGGTPDYPSRFFLGEGLVGQVAQDKTPLWLHQLPKDFLKVTSALGEAPPVTTMAYPVLLEGQVKLVVELGFLTTPDERVATWLDSIGNALAIAVESALERETKARLLDTTQRQAQELELQQNELQVALEQAHKIEGRLRQSQSDLMSSNEELKREQAAADAKARELDLANQYKARFLANMSHELRTPLNSIMLLSQNMAKNKPGNLGTSQIKSLEIVHASGADLLALINEILDFSKIESRTVSLNAERLSVDNLVFYLREHFVHLTQDKGLDFIVTVEEGTPEAIVSDPLRVRQIVKNLLSNAIKFTDYGSIAVTIARGGEAAKPLIAITVKDTGCGIKSEDKSAVFEAFTQVGERRMGAGEGTGLGLSIARELALMLGGDIKLVSELGVGSAFTLYLPWDGSSAIKTHTGTTTVRRMAPNRDKGEELAAAPMSDPVVDDDRRDLRDGDRVILIVEDDISFGQVLANLCRERGFKALRAHSAEEGLALLKKYAPTGVLLDILLPGMDGITLLDRVKDDLDVRHIPVHVMSVESAAQTVMRKGAIGFMHKPVTEEQVFAAIERMAAFLKKQVKQVLVVEDDAKCMETLLLLLGENGLVAHGAKTASATLEMIDRESYDCIVLDLGLPDMEGYELLRLLDQKHNPLPPVIINTGREISEEDEYRLHKYADSIILKSVKSNERLLDEVTLFLHKITSELPPPAIAMLQRMRDKDGLLKGKCVLIIDDDIRNLYALSSALEERGMEVLCASSGEKAYAMLDKRGDDIALILTDIMMPVEDGYSVITRLRQREGFAQLPVIALTAKAMKDDRERCLRVGASDYLTKPVELDSLMSMMARLVGP